MTLQQETDSLQEAKLQEEAYVVDEIKRTKYGVPIDESYSLAASEEVIQRTAESLRRNGFEVYIVDAPQDTRKLVENLLPPDKSVFTALSQTVKLSGLDDVINGPESKFISLRKEIGKLDRATHFREQVKLGAAPDVVVGSVHAITETGQVLIASGTGSQLAPYAAGAERVFWIVGSQKLVRDFNDAMWRLEMYAYPMEDARMHETMNLPSGLAKILIVNREIFPGRTTIVIVRETIGF
jgi:hypothetical protein